MFVAAEDATGTTVWDNIVGFFASFGEGWEKLGTILVIIVATVLLRWALLILVRRTVKQIVSGVKDKQHIDETSQILISPLAQARVIQRTRTIGSVLQNVITWVLVFVALGSILAQLNFNVTALLASAGIIGAALGFGAQNIIKDLLSGLFMVFEDQLGVGDIVDLGIASGLVEAVGVRVTQVRDVDGTLWYVRNGEIVRVGNKSQGWGRAVVEIVVPSDQPLDDVEQQLLTAAHEVVTDPAWRRKIVGTPEVWGLDTLSGDGMVFKLAVKTRPAQQTLVSRELRKHIHDALAAAGVPLIATTGATVPLTPPAKSRKGAKSAAPKTGPTPTKSGTASTKTGEVSSVPTGPLGLREVTLDTDQVTNQTVTEDDEPDDESLPPEDRYKG